MNEVEIPNGKSLLAALAAAALLPGCQMLRDAPPPATAAAPAGEEDSWTRVVTPDDRDRLERLDAAWEEALREASGQGFRRQVRAEGPLLDPDAGLARAAPAPGSYTCRVIKLGSGEAGARAYRAYKPFFCHVGVEGELLSITKQTGSERPGGYLWESGQDDRLVFVGSMALGDEAVPLPYGEDPARDMVGVFERVGPMRYRLAVPWPRGPSKLDVFELVPAPVQPEGD